MNLLSHSIQLSNRSLDDQFIFQETERPSSLFFSSLNTRLVNFGTEFDWGGWQNSIFTSTELKKRVGTNHDEKINDKENRTFSFNLSR